MNAQTLEFELNRRFSEPLEDYYQRRIIFWFDEKGEFANLVDEIRLENAKLVKISHSNLFRVKKLLAHDDLESNYLAYCPIKYDNLEDDWLLDLKLCNEEFRADLTEIWLDDLRLKGEDWARRELEPFRQFFDAKERREQVAQIVERDGQFNKSKLWLAILSVLSGAPSSTPNAVLRAVFKSGPDAETNDVYQNFLQFENVAPLFKRLARQACEYESDELNLRELAVRVLLSASLQTVDSDSFSDLKRFLSTSRQARCYDFVSEWANDSGDFASFEEFARTVEEEVGLRERFARWKVEDLCNATFFPCVDEIILQKITKQIVERSTFPEFIETVFERRRATIWRELWSNYYVGLSYVAKILAFEQEHGAGFHETSPTTFWRNYESDYYRMDSFYREFQRCFQRALTEPRAELNDLFKQVAERVEDIYSAFLARLGESWSKVAADDFQKEDGFFGIERQATFYRRYVKPNAGSKRLFVVVSDALRYEVGAALAEKLRLEKQSKVKLESLLGIFPTTTAFGMAALLPSSKLTVKKSPDADKLTVSADGLPTDASNRDAVLKKARANSVALKYKDFVGLQTSAQLAQIKGAEIVYIYHDRIDETSHASEDKVFSACDEAIQELCSLVRLIVSTFKGTRVLITSDHGFLYTYRPLTEDAKLSRSAWKSKSVEYGKRHAILPKGVAPKSMAPVRFLDGSTEYEAFSPYGCVRIKASGGGSKFVHGGASLQELVVPLIDFRYLRANSREYSDAPEKFDARPVPLRIVSAERKICNLTFSLDFYQPEAVGPKRVQENYSLYFTDSRGERVSDVARIVADRTSPDARERAFRCKFHLKDLAFDNKDVYYLTFVGEHSQTPQRIEFQIDVPFAKDEVGFFD